MKKLFITAILFLFTLQNVIPQMMIEADNEKIQYSGRISFSNPKKPVFSYSGVGIKAKFKGTSIAIKLDVNSDENYFFILIDNENPFKLHTEVSKSKYLLGNGLSDTSHTIEIIKITETNGDLITFNGFVIDDKKMLLDLPAPPLRKIEFIGDSITCGYGNEGDRNDTYNPAQQNYYYTYASFAARDLNAQQITVCDSGKGVYRNYGDPKSGSINPLPSFYDKINIGSLEMYDFRTYQPDVVCINLGTNDMSESNGDITLFKDAYATFLGRLRNKYPNTKLVCLIGSMLYGDNLRKVRTALKDLVLEFNAKGDNEVSLFEMSCQTGEFGIGGDWHPTVEQHRHNGKELTNYLSNLMGWSTLSVYENTLKNISIYPNPVTDYLIVQSANQEIETYILRNSQGQKIDEGIVVNHKINVASLQSGAYFIQFKNKSSIFNYKFIK